MFEIVTHFNEKYSFSKINLNKNNLNGSRPNQRECISSRRTTPEKLPFLRQDSGQDAKVQILHSELENQNVLLLQGVSGATLADAQNMAQAEKH